MGMVVGLAVLAALAAAQLAAQKSPAQPPPRLLCSAHGMQRRCEASSTLSGTPSEN